MNKSGGRNGCEGFDDCGHVCQFYVLLLEMTRKNFQPKELRDLTLRAYYEKMTHLERKYHLDLLDLS